MSHSDRREQSPRRPVGDPQPAQEVASQPDAQTLDARRAWMPPPLPFLAGLALGWGGDAWRPWSIVDDPRISLILMVAGVIAVASAVALIVGASRALARHGTSPDTAAESTAMVATGPFAFSRNPIYLALALLHIAIAFFVNNAWMLLMLVPALIAVDRIVVVGEERYLAVRFGRAYRDYASRVRRWL